ncbi:hypothetical protein GCM10022416_54300 [Actinomadura keratinilytica]|uniref:Uncharacterized protein n=1 Tax=Actinomadura keratinilytica TaxID=547461 RepID=A0ABP7ZDP5_9ACTN
MAPRSGSGREEVTSTTAPAAARSDEALVGPEDELGAALPDDLSDDHEDVHVMSAAGGWCHDDLSVDQLCSETLGGVESEETFEEGVLMRLWS